MQSAAAGAPQAPNKHGLVGRAFREALVAGGETHLSSSETQPATQDWEHLSLWAALGGEPDTDFVEGQCEGTWLNGTWIVSHHNGPELVIARALQ